jgi:hypothetical protein
VSAAAVPYVRLRGCVSGSSSRKCHSSLLIFSVTKFVPGLHKITLASFILKSCLLEDKEQWDTRNWM